jgi:hypothetical protein
MATFSQKESENIMEKKILTQEEEAARKEARRMVRERLAPDIPQALVMLEKIQSQAAKSDILILYTDAITVRDIFNNGKPFAEKLFGEQPYAGEIRAAFIPSGILNRPGLKNQPIVFGRIIELVSEDKISAQLVAIIGNFRFNGKNGILFSNNPAQEIWAKGSRTFEQIHPEMNLFRWEVSPEEDIIAAIFHTWANHLVSRDFSLVLFIAKNKAVIFS